MHPDAHEGRGEIGGEAGELSGRLVLVLGCHRSGTSVVAQSLTCLGAELGPKSQWSGADNPSGFAEDLDVLAIDEILLTMLGIPWFNAEPIDWPPQSRDMTRLGAFVTKLVRERLRQFPLWAVKEPRLCRLLPFWRPVFAAVGCSVSVVHVVRHPLAVAQSMLHRNGIPIESGLAVWLAYTRAARADADPAWRIHQAETRLIPGRKVGAPTGQTTKVSLMDKNGTVWLTHTNRVLFSPHGAYALTLRKGTESKMFFRTVFPPQ